MNAGQLVDPMASCAVESHLPGCPAPAGGDHALRAGWHHKEPDRDRFCDPEPRPFGELLRAGFCRYCDEPIRLVEVDEP